MHRARAAAFGLIMAIALARPGGTRGAGPATFLFDVPDLPATGRAEPWFTHQAGWSPLEEDDTTHTFQGNPVFLNDQVIAVLEPDAPQIALYSRQTEGMKLCARLQPVCEGRAARKRTSLAIRENSRTSVSLEIGLLSPRHQPLRITYELGAGQPFIRTTASPGVDKLRVQAPCRFVLLPDFFGDDIVVDAAALPVAQAELPSENFLLHFLPGGDALVMTVAESRDTDVTVGLSTTEPKAIVSTDVAYGRRPQVWVALLAGPGVWGQRVIRPADAGRVIPLDWQMPFPALWRVNWSKPDGLTESWEMLLQRPDGQYAIQNWFGQKESEGQSFGQEFGARDWNKPNRQRWNPVLGSFQFPCWVDTNRQGYLQPLAPRNKPDPIAPPFVGPTLIYPLDRVQAAPFQTPLDNLTVVDLVRMTLGVGPCQFILDLEGQKRNSRGVATCYARDVINAIYKQGDQARQGPVIEEHLDQCVAFIRNVRERIDLYGRFGREMTAYLEEQKRLQPRHAGFLDDCLVLTRKLDRLFEENRDKIRTPAVAQEHADRFRAELLHDTGTNAYRKCETQMAVFTSIGGAQDDLVAACRMIVKILRQRVGIAVALNPALKDIAARIRERTQTMLRNPTAYEAPRH